MKKTYIIPFSKCIVLTAKEYTLSATSSFSLSNEEVDDAKSRRQQEPAGSPIWDSWAE